MREFLLAAALLAGASSLAGAQTVGRTKSGEEVQLGWIGSADKTCNPNPAPSVKPATLAKNGQIRLSPANVRTTKIAGCPATTVPAVVVFYKPKADFKGEDSFTLNVQSKGGTDAKREFRVNVE